MKNRKGKISYNSAGQKMIIIDYKRSDNIDIQFEDGTIVKNKTYQSFIKGNIKNPNDLMIKVGETSYSTQGQLMTIIKYVNNRNIDIQFDDGTVVYKKTYQSFINGKIKNPNKIKGLERIGEEGFSNAGQKMKIIAYRGYEDIDVEFEDKTIVYNKRYGSFKRGEISNPNFRTTMETYNRIMNEISIATNGQKMKIIKFRNHDDVDVQFEDNTIVEHKSYYSFKSGKIENPNKKTNNAMSLNEFVLHYYFEQYGFNHKKCGSLKEIGLEMLELDLYNSKINVAIEYDGYYHTNEKDEYKNLLCKKVGLTLFRIREPKLEKLIDGNSINYVLKSTNAFSKDYENYIKNIIKYLNENFNLSIDIEVDLKKDKEEIKKKFNEEYVLLRNRLGEVGFSNTSGKMTIVKYYRCDDIDVMFEDGTVVENRTYQSFVKGEIKNPNLDNSIVRVGEQSYSTEGQLMTIIKYVNNQDIDIQFEDNTIVEHKSYHCFLMGHITNPNYDKTVKYIGEKAIALNGQEMEIIAYRKSKEVDIKFEDGTIVYNKRYSHFKDGCIKNPNYKYNKK